MKIKAEPLSDHEDNNTEELSNVRRSKRQRRVINWSVLKSFRKKRKTSDVDEGGNAAPCDVQCSSSETRIKSEKSLIEDMRSSTFNTLFNGHQELESESVSNDSPVVISVPPSAREMDEAQKRELSPETTLTAESETEFCDSPEKENESFIVDHSYFAHPGEPMKKQIKQEKEILSKPEPPVTSFAVDIQTLAVYRALIDHTYSSITPSSLIDAVMLKHDYICTMSEMGQFSEHFDDSPHFLMASSSIKKELEEKSGRPSKKAGKTRKEKQPNRTRKRLAESPLAPVENNFVTNPKFVPNPKFLPKGEVMDNCFECEFDLHDLPPKIDQYSRNELPKKKRKCLKVLKPKKPPRKISEVEEKLEKITASPTPEDVKSRKRKRRWNQTGWPTKKPQLKSSAAKENTKCKVRLPKRETSKVKVTTSKSNNSLENPKSRNRLAQTKKSDLEKKVPDMSMSIEEAVKKRRQSLSEDRVNKQAAHSPTRERARRKVKSLYQRPLVEDSKEDEAQRKEAAKNIRKRSKSESASELQSPSSKPKKHSQSSDKEVGDSTNDNVEDEKPSISTRPKRAKRRDYYKLQKIGRDSASPSKEKYSELPSTKLEEGTEGGASDVVADDVKNVKITPATGNASEQSGDLRKFEVNDKSTKSDLNQGEETPSSCNATLLGERSACSSSETNGDDTTELTKVISKIDVNDPPIPDCEKKITSEASGVSAAALPPSTFQNASDISTVYEPKSDDAKDKDDTSESNSRSITDQAPSSESKSRGKQTLRDRLDFAFHLLENGASVRKAALASRVSRRCIQRHYDARKRGQMIKNHGGRPKLNKEFEKSLAERLMTLCEWGYTIDTFDLRQLVKMHADERGLKLWFNENLPGTKWVRDFLNRNSSLLSLTPQAENIKLSRAEVDEDTIIDYFKQLGKKLEGVPQENIINYGLSNLHNHCEMANNIKASTPIMFACTAAGEMFPLYVVYKSKHLYDTWIKGGPSGTRYNRNVPGRFDGNCFDDWMKTVIVPKARRTQGRKVMIGDFLSSHISPKCMELCRRYEIEFVFLPPNSTHVTRPLDTAVFRPIDAAWKRILFEWDKTKGKKYAAIPKDCFPRLLSGLMSVLNDNFKNDIQVAFKNCGIFPLDRSSVLQRLPLASQSDRSDNTSLYSSCVGTLKVLRSPQRTHLRRKRKLICARPGRSGPLKVESSEDSEEDESGLCSSEEEEEVDEEDSEEGTDEIDDDSTNEDEDGTGQVETSQEKDVHRGEVGRRGTECPEDVDSNVLENTHSNPAEPSLNKAEVPKLDSKKDAKKKVLPKQVPRVRQSIRQRVRHHLSKLFKMRCSKKQKSPTSPNIVKVQQRAASKKTEAATEDAKVPSEQHVVAPKQLPSVSPKKRRRKKMFWRTSWKANFTSSSKKKANLGQRAVPAINPEEDSAISQIKNDEPFAEVGASDVVASEVDASKEQLGVDLSIVKDEPDEPDVVGCCPNLPNSSDCNEQAILKASPTRQDVRSSESKDGSGLVSSSIQESGASKESLNNSKRSPGERLQLSNPVSVNASSEMDDLTCSEVFTLEAEVVSPSIETLFQSGLNRNLEDIHDSDAFEPDYDSPLYADSDEEVRSSCFKDSDSGRPANIDSDKQQTKDVTPASPISIKCEEVEEEEEVDDDSDPPDATRDWEDEVTSFGGELRNPWERRKFSKYSSQTRRMIRSIGAVSDEEDSMLSDDSVADDCEDFWSHNRSSEGNRFFKLPSIDVEDDQSRFIVNPRAFVKLRGGIYRIRNGSSENAQLPALQMREVSPIKTVPSILRKNVKSIRPVSPPRIRFTSSIASTSSNDHQYCKKIGDRVIRPNMDVIGKPVLRMGNWRTHPPKIIWREAPIDTTMVKLKKDRTPYTSQARFTYHSQTPPVSKSVRRAEVGNVDPHELGGIVALDKPSFAARSAQLRAYAPGMFEGPMDQKSKKQQPQVDGMSRTNPYWHTMYELPPEIERLDALVRGRLGLPPMTTKYYHRKDGRPPFSYNTMAMMAIEKDRLKCATSRDVIEFVSAYFPFYRNLDSKWQQNLRLVLSTKKYFRCDRIGSHYFYSFSNQLRLPSDPAIYEMTDEAFNNDEDEEEDEEDLVNGDEAIESPNILFSISSLEAPEEPREEIEPDPFVPICSYSDEEPDDNGLPPHCDITYGDDTREPPYAMGDTLEDSLDTLKIKEEPEDKYDNDCGKTEEISTTKHGRKFHCPYCPASFGNLQDSMDHSITHPEVMKPCPLCDFSSPDGIQLLWHINANHNG